MRVTKCVRLKDESSHPWGEAKTQDLMLQGGFGTAVQTLPRQIELDLEDLTLEGKICQNITNGKYN